MCEWRLKYQVAAIYSFNRAHAGTYTCSLQHIQPPGFPDEAKSHQVAPEADYTPCVKSNPAGVLVLELTNGASISNSANQHISLCYD